MSVKKISDAGIALIKSFEGCRLDAYKCPTGKWTIGYGHTGGVTAGQKITAAQAEAYLRVDLERFEKNVAKFDSKYHWTQNEFDALVSFAYNLGSIDKLIAGGTRSKAVIAKKMILYTKDGEGNVLQGLVRRRKAEQEMFLSGKSTVGTEKAESCKAESCRTKFKVGSARIDENGKLSGGAAGDQTGKEVSTQDYYMHSKGWYLFRPKTTEDAEKIAAAMQSACDNANIGYDQGNRLDVITQVKRYGSMEKISVKTEADCSSLVRACCVEAGFDPGNFNTASEAVALEKTGRFRGKMSVTASMILYDGDILVTKTKGHTVVVVPVYKKNGKRQTLRTGSRNSDVTYLQKRLTAQGYGVGEIDGSFGQKTLEAVKAYQADYGLTVDGIVGAKTWASLVA